MKKPWIGLLDCNNFFVSCERLFRPDLIGKPVIVLSSNDGCVVARSKEVKDIGIPMGVPYFQIKDIIKKEGIVTFSSHLALYRDVSRRVFNIMKDEVGLIEQYSIDEAFFTSYSDPLVLSRCLKTVIEKQVGIPVSIGVSRTKTQAKYANTLAKKNDGICLLDSKEWESLVSGINLSDIWGIGSRSEMTYKKHGLFTVADLCSVDKERVRKVFGVSGATIQQELMSNPVFEVKQALENKQSIISSRSFSNTTTDKAVLADAISYHVSHATANLRRMDMEASEIRVSIKPSRHGNFILRGGSKEAVLTVPTSDSLTFLRVANNLLNDLFESGVPYKKAGITLSNFTSSGVGQKTLFDVEKSRIDKTLMSVIDVLNARKDKEVILLGTRLLKSTWQAKSEERSPAYTTKWNDVSVVKAK